MLVFSRYGNEDKFVTLFGVIQALVSVVHDTEDDSIVAIKAGQTNIVFLLKSPLILVGVIKMDHCAQQVQTHLS